MSRVGSVIALWCKRQLTTRQVVRLAQRVARFERWGVRPITQARFAALIAAADGGRTPPAAAPAVPDITPQMALTVAELRGRLDESGATIAHLRRLASGYEEAVEAAAAASAALADTRTLAGRGAARELAMQHALETANQKISHLQAVSTAYAALVCSS